MREQTPKRKAATSWIGAAYENGRGRMLLALVLLLVALAVVVVNDREYWFGQADASVADENTPEWNPSSVTQVPATAAAASPVAPAAPKLIKHVQTAPAIAEHPAIAVTRSVVPPLEVEVVAGASHGTVHLGNNAENVELPLGSRFGAEDSASVNQAPATAAAERVRMALAKAPARPQTVEPVYPSLSRQMKVQGSVLLQAFIGPDGVIQDLRVLSGPAILASAAREAARQWQFKPYMQNGQAVETQAKITVNFTIKVLENGVRDQMDTVVALSRGGE